MDRTGITMREKLRALGWYQFQNLVAGAFSKQGYSVETLPRSVALTTGIDLILRRGTAALAVRCTHGDAWRVGLRLLRQFAEARIAANIPHGILVSASGFTDEVFDHAESYQVVPWDVPEILKFLEDSAAAQDPVLSAWLLDERRLCPHHEKEVRPDAWPSPFDSNLPCLSCPSVRSCSYTLGIWAEHARIRRQVWPRPRVHSPALSPRMPPDKPAVATLQMLIGPRDSTHSRARFEPTHLLSLLDPGSNVDGLRPPWISPENHHVELIHDVRDPANPLAPQESNIRSVIDWLRPRCEPGSTHRFLIHCQAGVGRSPAVGYVAWALHLGPGHEQEAWNRMRESCLKKWVIPNSLVIDHADSILGRGGALCDPLNRWSVVLPWSRLQ